MLSLSMYHQFGEVGTTIINDDSLEPEVPSYTNIYVYLKNMLLQLVVILSVFVGGGGGRRGRVDGCF